MWSHWEARFKFNKHAVVRIDLRGLRSIHFLGLLNSGIQEVKLFMLYKNLSLLGKKSVERGLRERKNFLRDFETVRVYEN